jgi:ubiquinone/menaquinone biosynthesis C-methylase UbiE
VIRAAQPAPDALAWRLSRFERGCRLAQELSSRLGSLQGKRILDVGAAHGGDVAALYAHGASCTGADRYDHDYATLKERIAPGDDRLDFRLFDCTEPWPVPDAAFDAVICLGVLEMIEDRSAFFREMIRVLRPGGIALVYTGTAFRMTRLDPHFRLPLIAMLPTPVRRWIAEHVFGRTYRFPLSRHTYYSARPFRRLVAPWGYDAVPEKYRGSALMAKLKAWPMASWWGALVREFAFDFVAIVPRPEAGSPKRRRRRGAISAAAVVRTSSGSVPR